MLKITMRHVLVQPQALFLEAGPEVIRGASICEEIIEQKRAHAATNNDLLSLLKALEDQQSLGKRKSSIDELSGRRAGNRRGEHALEHTVHHHPSYADPVSPILENAERPDVAFGLSEQPPNTPFSIVATSPRMGNRGPSGIKQNDVSFDDGREFAHQLPHSALAEHQVQEMALDR